MELPTIGQVVKMFNAMDSFGKSFVGKELGFTPNGSRLELESRIEHYKRRKGIKRLVALIEEETLEA